MDSVAVSGFGVFVTRLQPHAGEGLSLRDIDDAGIAMVIARPGAGARTFEALLDPAPDACGGATIAIGPGNLLVVRRGPVPAWIAQLSQTTAGVAHVFDHSSAYALLELGGPAVCVVLQKGIFIDLDRALADVGASLCSVIAHINVFVWRSASDRVVIAVPRSFAGSFWHWLATTAAAENITLGRKIQTF